MTAGQGIPGLSLDRFWWMVIKKKKSISSGENEGCWIDNQSYPGSFCALYSCHAVYCSTCACAMIIEYYGSASGVAGEVHVGSSVPSLYTSVPTRCYNSFVVWIPWLNHPPQGRIQDFQEGGGVKVKVKVHFYCPIQDTQYSVKVLW